MRTRYLATIFFGCIAGSLAWSCRASAATIFPTEYDQYMLELLNRARANPAAEAAAHGIDLNEGLTPGTISTAAKQPLAFNLNLEASADGHAAWMIANSSFGHSGPGGNQPNQRMTNAGYSFQIPWSWGENIAWLGQTGSVPNLTTSMLDLHNGLFVDAGVALREHRTAMLNASFREFGNGVATGTYNGYNAVMLTQDFASTAGNSFLTGVVFNDLNSNNFYSVGGEGFYSITVTATPMAGGASKQTKTFSTGGYTLQLAAGTYHVEFVGPTLGTVAFDNVAIGAENIKLDVKSSQPPHPWMNFASPLDVDRNGTVQPLDALTIINRLNAVGSGPLSATVPPGGPFYDVNGDNYLSPLDALMVINALNKTAITSSATPLLSAEDQSMAEFLGEGGSAVPEPSSVALALLGVVGIGIYAIRTRRRFDL